MASSSNKDENYIKEMGRNLKQSLQEERRKRKEIVRLEHHHHEEEPLPPINTTTQSKGYPQILPQQQPSTTTTFIGATGIGISSNLLKSSMRSCKKFGQSVKQSSQKKKTGYSKRNNSINNTNSINTTKYYTKHRMNMITRNIISTKKNGTIK